MIAVASQVPLAIFLETQLHSNIQGSLNPGDRDSRPSRGAVETAPVLAALAITYVVARHRVGTWLELLPALVSVPRRAVLGLAFGGAEQAHYLVDTYVPGLLNTQNLLGGVYIYTEQVTWRLISDPISHACSAGMSGYFLGIAIRRG